MTKKMLIDAAHPEEIRVAVIDQRKVEDFDFESAARKPLRGNIYLARVTRVEPSLQAAFVEYGGNRHGFLAFNEIHPDYYQVPVSDREALQRAEAEEAELAAELELLQRGDETDDDGDIQMGAADDDDEAYDASDDASDDSPENDDTDDAAYLSDDSADDEADASGNDDLNASFLNESVEVTDEAQPDDTDDAETSSDDGETPERDEEEEEEDTEDGSKGDDESGEKNKAASSKDAPSKVDAEETVTETALEEVEDDTPAEPTDTYDAEAIANGEQPAITLDNEDFPTAADDEDGVEDNVTAADAEDDADSDADATAENEDAADASEDEGASDSEESLDENQIAARKAAKARAALFERYKEAKRKRARLLRNYKIQEVIKRRQILLVQVVKEERGNKGAALTTYLSLAGRYCVLMPNTARGGGISRKIPSATDRRRLRRVVDDLDVPTGMGLIIRTAGAKRTKTEIKRDYDYLIRLWESIRTLTLKSIAPCLVYEEASLIKRAIRDLYDKDIGQVLVEGEAGYREAKDFMKMLMPSHAKNVQPHKDATPIFLKYGVESQLDGMYQPSVRLKSGGYIVIHQTEALVAIDVNSGRATRERNIEQTALKTNIEAAQEAARQFRLRDLAGLIVIDFIDMEEPKNNRTVERKFKDAIKADRARIQTGRISNFGLLELSRQRRRSGIVDGTTNVCPTCNGAGVIRSHEMASLRILRAIEGDAISGKVGRVSARASLDVALHILNHNRDWIRRIEEDNGVTIEIIADASKAGDNYEIEKSGTPRDRKAKSIVVTADNTDWAEAAEEDESDLDKVASDEESTDEEQDGGKKKRRRRRRKKDAARKNNKETDAEDTDAVAAQSDDDSREETQSASDGDDEDKPKRRRRRGRRGGRRNRKDRENGAADVEAGEAKQETTEDADGSTPAADDGSNGDASDQPAPASAAASTPDSVFDAVIEPKAAKSDAETDMPPAEPAQDEEQSDAISAGDGVPDEKAAAIPDNVQPEPAAQASAEEAAPDPKKPTRKGWWQRAIGG